MTPFGWFSGFSFLTQCYEIKDIGASQILTMILAPVIIFQSLFSGGRAGNDSKHTIFFVSIVWNVFQVKTDSQMLQLLH